MNRSVATVLCAAALLAAGGVILETGAAGGVAPQATASKPATVTMFANVDAEGDLGSHVGATKVTVHRNLVLTYDVSFVRQIGHCAAVVQVGKAGGPDTPTPAVAEVIPDTSFSPSTFGVAFTNLQGQNVKEPFMITVTCKS